MPNQLKDVDFSRHSLNIADILYFLLFEYFYGHFLACKIMISKLDFAECALANSLTEDIVTDVFEL
jgi:hypothetical protein